MNEANIPHPRVSDSKQPHSSNTMKILERAVGVEYNGLRQRTLRNAKQDSYLRLSGLLVILRDVDGI
jgi:hypothetical protein